MCVVFGGFWWFLVGFGGFWVGFGEEGRRELGEGGVRWGFGFCFFGDRGWGFSGFSGFQGLEFKVRSVGARSQEPFC